MNDPVWKVMYSQPITLAELRILEGDPPAGLKDSVKRKVSQTLLRYEQQLRTKQINGVNAAAEQVREQQVSVKERLDNADERIEDITEAVKAGRMDPADAEKEIASILKKINGDRALLDQVEQSLTRITEQADQDPAEWQISLQERFPALKNNLPVITQEWLLGTDDADPLEGGA